MEEDPKIGQLIKVIYMSNHSIWKGVDQEKTMDVDPSHYFMLKRFLFNHL
jgi:hypothetical protein